MGKILLFNVATNALEGTIDSHGSQLALSADGSVLVAGGAVIWSDSKNGNPLPQPIRLSPDGTLIAVSSAHDVTAATNI